jgi:ferredoxin-NADP reductase
VWWLQAARDGADRPFASEAAALLAALPRAHSRVCFSRPGPRDEAGRDYDSAGRLSVDVLRPLGLSHDSDAYLCGPAGFLIDVTAALVEVGIPADRIHTEVFGAKAGLTPGISAAGSRPPHPPAGPPGDGPPVSFARSGLTVPATAGDGSLLDLAEHCDVPVRWSCRIGVCHTCETGLLAGEVSYTTEPIDPPAAGNVLICSARPRGPVVLDL